MLLGAPVLLAATWFLFNPGSDIDWTYLLIWSLVVYTGWTLVTLPYLAWGAEISDSYHGRTQLTASREAFVIAGTLLAVGIPVALFDEPTAEALAPLSWALLLLLPVAVIAAVAVVPERATRHALASNAWRRIRQNRPFQRLGLAFLLNGTANATAAGLFLFYVEFVLQAPGLAYPLLAIYFTAGLVGLALWLPVARRLGKHRAWALSMLLASLVFAFVPFLTSGDTGLFLLVCLLTGLSLGSDMALPAAIQADVLERERNLHQEDSGGWYFGLWGMITKLAMALGVGLALPLVGWAGFDPNHTNTAAALTGLALAYGLLPLPFKLAAAYLVWRFPLDQHTIARLRRTTDDVQIPAPAMGNHPMSNPGRLQHHEA
jgi:Na+/melibiose symporter-like transporter